MSGHTQGPWRFDEDWGRLPTIFGANGAKVAIVEKVGGVRPDRSEHTAEQSADARLIAAAPDILAALKEAVGFQNEDTKCLSGTQSVGGPDAEDEREECPDRRCYDHGCMVARVNRWRAAIDAQDVS